MYGPSNGPLRETTPVNPTSAKSRTRADHVRRAPRRPPARRRPGRHRPGLGLRRPRRTRLRLRRVRLRTRARRQASPDRWVDPTPSTPTATSPMSAATSCSSASRDDAYGRVWHLPNPPTRTTRHIIIDVYAAAGQRRTDVTALKRPMLRALGLFNRNVRELLHTYYQFDAPFVVDDSAFRHAFGGHTTAWDDIVATTVDWYRTHDDARALHRPHRDHDPEGDRMMSSLAALVVRRRRAVITLWIVLLLAAGTVGSSAFSVLSSSFGAGPSTESGRVTERLDDLAETGGEIAIIADGIDVDDPATARALGDGLERIAAIDGVIAIADPWSTGADALRATDGRAALAVVTDHRRARRGGRGRPRPRDHRGRTRPRRTRGARRRERARGRAVRHRLGERPAPRRGHRPAHRLRRHDLPARRASRRRHALPRRPRRGDRVARRAGGGDPARRRVDLLDQRREHARHRPGHRLRAADGQPVPRGTRPRTGGPRRGRPDRRHRRDHRGVLRPHRRGRDVRPVRVRRAHPLLVRHRRPQRRPALHDRGGHAAARHAGRGRRQDPAFDSDRRRRGPLLPAHPVGAGPRRRRGRGRRGRAAPPRRAVPRHPVRDRRRPHPAPVVRGARRRAHPRRPVPGTRHRPGHRDRRRRPRQPRARRLARPGLAPARRRRDLDPARRTSGRHRRRRHARRHLPGARRIRARRTSSGTRGRPSTPRSVASPPSSSTSRPGSPSASRSRRSWSSPPRSCCCSS